MPDRSRQREESPVFRFDFFCKIDHARIPGIHICQHASWPGEVNEEATNRQTRNIPSGKHAYLAPVAEGRFTDKMSACMPETCGFLRLHETFMINFKRRLPAFLVFDYR